MPKRVQIRRTAGWFKPEGCILVARPGPYGNPFPVEGDWIAWTAVGLGLKADKAGRRLAAVRLHRAWITEAATIETDPISDEGGLLTFGDGKTEVTMSLGEHAAGIALFAATLCEKPKLPPVPDLAPLRGHDLACWCPLIDEKGNPVPCHADVLLELANRDG